MKVSPMSELIPAYRDIKPVDTRENELNIEKVGAVQIQSAPVAEPRETEPKKDSEIDDGRETIAVSRDGDVAKASREAIENMKEGMVIRKDSDPAEKDAVKNVTGEEKKEVSSLLSYSEDELQRLYLQGRIDSNSLEKEIERRKDLRGEKDEAAMAVVKDEKEENKRNNDYAINMENKREEGVEQVTVRDEKVNEAHKEISDNKAEQTAMQRTQERDDAAQAAADNGNTESKRIITEDMERDEEFVQRMSVLAGAKEDTQIKAEALNTAAENGRLKMMEQVIGVDPAMASNV